MNKKLLFGVLAVMLIAGVSGSYLLQYWASTISVNTAVSISSTSPIEIECENLIYEGSEGFCSEISLSNANGTNREIKFDFNHTDPEIDCWINDLNGGELATAIITAGSTQQYPVWCSVDPLTDANRYSTELIVKPID